MKSSPPKVKHSPNRDSNHTEDVPNCLVETFLLNRGKSEIEIEEFSMCGQLGKDQPWIALQDVSPNVPSLSFGLALNSVSPPQLKIESPDLGCLDYGQENSLCSLPNFGGDEWQIPRNQNDDRHISPEYPLQFLDLDSSQLKYDLTPHASGTGYLLGSESKLWSVQSTDCMSGPMTACHTGTTGTQPTSTMVVDTPFSENTGTLGGKTLLPHPESTPIGMQKGPSPVPTHGYYPDNASENLERRSKRSKKRYRVDLDDTSSGAHANHSPLQQTGAIPTQVYRGVSKHRLTHRWEASLWLNGKQMYLGGFDSQEDAARAYDLAALACKGSNALINFGATDYKNQLQEINGFTKEEVVAYVRRRSAAFSRGKSRYRGVSGHNNRWEARIGSFGGRKNVSLDSKVHSSTIQQNRSQFFVLASFKNLSY
jgi:hypothetical protein